MPSAHAEPKRFRRRMPAMPATLVKLMTAALTRLPPLLLSQRLRLSGRLVSRTPSFERIRHRIRVHNQVRFLCEHPERSAPPQRCLKFGGA
jgi:hypothetical protein